MIRAQADGDVMPVDLTKSLSFKSASNAEKAMLAQLQGNILKGHGREHTAHLFLKFDPAKAAAIRAWIRQQAASVTTAAAQLAESEARKLAKVQGRRFVSDPVKLLFISAAGYQALTIAAPKQPMDAAFRGGMGTRDLNDPPVVRWEAHLKSGVHAMLLLADVSAAKVVRLVTKMKAAFPVGVMLLGQETGLAIKNANRDGIEHFGYVDGRSQPLLLIEDIEREKNGQDGTSVWNPAFPIGQALVPDPAGTNGVSFGSYFVFRKLKQDVKGFKDKEKALAKALGLKGDDAERAGAMIVGRFEDGTPLVLQKADGMHHPVPNNFDYANDPDATKCPFHAHIRKSNPRGESVGSLASTLAEERSHIMARRGITYGGRTKLKNGEFALPRGEVGLLFMAYQNDIANQFEFTQATWVNNPDFLKPGTGIDPVIGQGGAGGQACAVGWGGTKANATFKKFDFRNFVKMKGGEYFFAPSIEGLKNL
jgi:Dyp-type peroxidase family